jgi:hypothetical protein
MNYDTRFILNVTHTLVLDFLQTFQTHIQAFQVLEKKTKIFKRSWPQSEIQ